jgi:hypothetical protein
VLKGLGTGAALLVGATGSSQARRVARGSDDSGISPKTVNQGRRGIEAEANASINGFFPDVYCGNGRFGDVRLTDYVGAVMNDGVFQEYYGYKTFGATADHDIIDRYYRDRAWDSNDVSPIKPGPNEKFADLTGRATSYESDFRDGQRFGPVISPKIEQSAWGLASQHRITVSSVWKHTAYRETCRNRPWRAKCSGYPNRWKNASYDTSLTTVDILVYQDQRTDGNDDRYIVLTNLFGTPEGSETCSDLWIKHDYGNAKNGSLRDGTNSNAHGSETRGRSTSTSVSLSVGSDGTIGGGVSYTRSFSYSYTRPAVQTKDRVVKPRNYGRWKSDIAGRFRGQQVKANPATAIDVDNHQDNIGTLDLHANYNKTGKTKVHVKLRRSAENTYSGNFSNPNRKFRIKSAASGKVLDVSGGGSAENGLNVRQWEDYGLDHQRWYIQRTGNGAYRIKSVASGRVLEVSGSGNPKNGKNIRQWEDYGLDHQRWYIKPTNGEKYLIESAATEKVVDVSGSGSTKNGLNVRQWEDYDLDHQRWYLY